MANILSILDLVAQVNHWNQQPRNLDKTDDIQGNNVEIITFFAPEKLQKTPNFLKLVSSFHVQD